MNNVATILVNTKNLPNDQDGLHWIKKKKKSVKKKPKNISMMVKKYLFPLIYLVYGCQRCEKNLWCLAFGWRWIAVPLHTDKDHTWVSQMLVSLSKSLAKLIHGSWKIRFYTNGKKDSPSLCLQWMNLHDLIHVQLQQRKLYRYKVKPQVPPLFNRVGNLSVNASVGNLSSHTFAGNVSVYARLKPPYLAKYHRNQSQLFIQSYWLISINTEQHQKKKTSAQKQKQYNEK